jgi:biotin-[acetyl-CoA-carboxylase] ligase BirA-like protein
MNNSYLNYQANQVLDQCASTNDIAKELAENDFPHGTWISTRTQNAGRGRLGRRWESIEGNLFLSLVARIPNQSLWSWVPLATAIGIAQCLRQNYTELEVQVKWPNDLYLKGAKLGGILCESAGSGARSFIVIGIGLNCVHAPEGLDQKVIDLTAARGGTYTPANLIRDEIRESILEQLDILVTHGSATIAELYRRWAFYPPGTQVKWGSPPQTGTVQDLGTFAELKVMMEAGNVVPIFAEDVTRVFTRPTG